jgi:hypothetical protein
MRIQNKLLGDAGEYYIAFELARRGINPDIMSRNSMGVDILATDDGQTVISIQVKTSAGRNQPRLWDVGKHSPNHSPTFFYIFINIWDESTRLIEYFVVPSEWVFINVNWSSPRPQFRLKTDEEYNRYLFNWSLILQFFDIRNNANLEINVG